MNTTALLSFVLLLGVCQSQLAVNEETGLAKDLLSEETHDQGIRKVLRRNVRNTFANLASEYVSQFENLIISNCKANGHDDAEEQLLPVYRELEECIGEKKPFVTPKEEFLANMEECSVEPINKTNNCLKENQRYITELTLSFLKRAVSLMYDDFDIIRMDLAPCIPKLSTQEVISSYKECLADTAQKTYDSPVLPPSKAEFCERLVPTAFCFTNMIKANCNNTPGLQKYRKDYIISHSEPCEEPEEIKENEAIEEATTEIF